MALINAGAAPSIVSVKVWLEDNQFPEASLILEATNTTLGETWVSPELFSWRETRTWLSSPEEPVVVPVTTYESATVKVPLVKVELSSSIFSDKVTSIWSIYPSPSESTVLAAVTVGAVLSALTVISPLLIEWLVPSVTLFDVPWLKVYFTVVVPNVLPETPLTVIRAILPTTTPEATAKPEGSLVGKVQSASSKTELDMSSLNLASIRSTILFPLVSL